VIGPVSRELDLPGGGDERAELVVPNFGQTRKAVVIVVTLGKDSDGYYYENEGVKDLPYRLNVGLRTGTFQSPNPMPLYTAPGSDAFPTWAPAGDEVVFSRAGPPLQLFRKKLDATPATPLIPQAGVDQCHPDWSPRGDWIAFDQGTNPNFDIFAFNPTTLQLRQLTSGPEQDFDVAFSPNGQQLAYARVVPGSSQIRRIDLSGANDTVLVQRSDAVGMSNPRWTPDGNWIYFRANDSLYAVGAGGANRGNVLNKSNLLRPFSNFDLPLGNGRIVANRQWTSPGCTGGELQFPIIARDTAQVVDEVLFYGSNANNGTWVRWSYDNTRIAYTSDQNGNADIFVGQVGYNHAPILTNVVDGFVSPNPWTLQLNASDADGEAITYAAAYLPLGGSLSPSGLLSFPATAEGSEHYVVLRAIDPSGGVDNRVVRYFTNSGGGGGGCPPPGCEQGRPFNLADEGTTNGPRFALAQNQPNPFGTTTLIGFEVPAVTKVKVEIFDLRGRRVRVVADDLFAAGSHSVAWDRKDSAGTSVPPGLYLYRMSAESFRDEKKMTLLP
jgi:hypothetical protein